MSRKVSTPLAISIIIVSAAMFILGIFVYTKYFYQLNLYLLNYDDGRCEKDSDCGNTCCGCISKNIECEIKCFALPIRNCECRKNQCITKKQLSIDSKEKAIEFAKNDEDFIRAVNIFKLDFDGKIIYNAYFYNEKGYWDVSVWPEGTLDLWYYIRFDNEGTIIGKGYGKGA